ncbi:MAG: phosphoribosyltransferase [Streptosporangiaceae bacterium]
MVEFPDVVQLAWPRPGHFDLGTGYHGDLWLDLDALLLCPSLLRAHVRWLAARLREHSVDALCGPLEGGAFLAYAVADLLGVAFLAGYRRPSETARYHLPAVPGGINDWACRTMPAVRRRHPYTDPLSGDVVTPLLGRGAGRSRHIRPSRRKC